jgi:zinc D-Ala-D-Ala carboxypeptidase
MKKYNPLVPYFTAADNINMAEDDTIGSLTRDDVVALLKQIQNAMTMQYYNRVYNFGEPPRQGFSLLASPGGKLTSTGDQWKFTVVHADGEYGVYKLGVTQLIDAGMFGSELNAWISNNLPNIPVPSRGNEEYESWYSRFLKYNSGKQTRILEAPVSARNNALYYMLIYPINGGDPRFSVSVHPDLAAKNADGQLTDHGDMHGGFIENPFLQDLAALNLLKFTYQLLLTSRAINEKVDKKTLAGALGLSLCWDIDATQNYLRGNVKTDANGISAKYWFDVGYNAVALPTEKVATPGPSEGTTSIVRDEEVTPPPTAEETSALPTDSTVVGTAKTTADSTQQVIRRIVKTNKFSTILYELTAAGTISAKVTTAAKDTPPFSSSSILSNPYTTSPANGITVSVYFIGGFDPTAFEIKIIDKIEKGGRFLYEGYDQLPGTDAVIALQKLIDKEGALRHDRGPGEWITAIKQTQSAITTNIATIVKQLQAQKEFELGGSIDKAESNKVIAFDDPADVETLVKQLDSVATYAQRMGNDFTFQACNTSKNEILANFTSDTQSITGSGSQTPITAADGSSTSSVSTLHASGAVTKVTTTTEADGTVVQEKSVEKVEAPLKEQPKSTIDNGISHPAQAGDAVNTAVNTPNAENLPTHENTNIAKADGKGFADPKKTYPKPDYVNKPDTNSLALGVNSPGINPDPRTSAGDKSSQSLGSSPAARNASRKRAVKMAGRSGSTWEQPATPYAAKYPYNKVFAGESGHALEIDDTPGFERLNIAHKSGTFTETGPDGTQVNKIIGNGYSIIEKDGFVLIEGNANVHIAGQCNVFIMNDTALTMHGKVSLDIHNDVNVNIGGSLGLSVQDGIYLRNEGDISIKNEGKVDADITGAVTTKTTGKYNLTTDAGLNLTSKVNTHIKSGGSFFNHSTGNMNLCTDAELLAKSTGDINLKTAAMINQESTGNVNIKTAGTINAESAGNISLKAPLIASSPIDTPTLDVTTANVTTLNAGSTNLRATGTDTGTNGGSTHNLPISGPTSATVTAPASAGSAEDAVCAVAAKLPVTYELEQPVSLSAPQPVERTTNDVATGYDGENSSMNTDGGEPDENGNVSGQLSGSSGETGDDCVDGGGDPSTSTSPDSDGSGTSGDGTVYPAPAGKSGIPPKDCNTLKGTKLPPLPQQGQKYDGTLKISPRITLAQLCNGRDGCPNGAADLRGHKSPGSKQNEYEILNNLRCLAVNVIEPLFDKYGSVTWSCGFRKYYPNGKKNKLDPNAHGWGSAVDLSFPKLSKKQYIDVCRWAASNLSAYDQIILEKNSGGSVWIHIGYVGRNGKSRGQCLTATPSGGGMKYTAGFKQVV